MLQTTSVDLYAISHLFGDELEFKKIKRLVASITPVYDFYFVSDLSTNRHENFYDIGHFRTPVGEQLKLILEGKASLEPYGYLLTPETCDAAFEAEDAAWEKWKSENSEYVQALTECIESGRKPQFGVFAKYIGF